MAGWIAWIAGCGSALRMWRGCSGGGCGGRPAARRSRCTTAVSCGWPAVRRVAGGSAYPGLDRPDGPSAVPESADGVPGGQLSNRTLTIRRYGSGRWPLPAPGPPTARAASGDPRAPARSWCTISVTSQAANLSSAPSANRPCVQATATERASCSGSRVSSSNTVVPHAISSSTMITSRPGCEQAARRRNPSRPIARAARVWRLTLKGLVQARLEQRYLPRGLV